MSRAGLSHLKVSGAGARLYLDTAPAEKPYLTGLTAYEGVISFQTLYAHESGDATVLKAWCRELLLIMVS